MRADRFIEQSPRLLTTPGRDDWEVRAVGALLSVGGQVALSGASARFAWGLERHEPNDLHLIVLASRVRPSATACGSLARGTSRRVHASVWPHRTTVEHSVLSEDCRGASHRPRTAKTS